MKLTDSNSGIIKKNILLVIYLSSFLLVQFSFNIGFSLKPYMLVSILMILIFLGKNKTITIQKNRRMPYYEMFFVCFVIYATIRNSFAGDIMLGFKGSIALCFSLFVYYFTFYCFKKISNEAVLKIIYKSGLLTVIIISIGFLLKDERIFELDRTVNRLRGYVQDPNFFALYFVLPLFISLFYSINHKKKILATGIFLIILFLTYSRAAYISILLAIIYLLFIQRKNIYKFKRKIAASILIIFSLIAILYTIPATKHIVEMAVNNIDSRFSESASRGAREFLIEIGVDTFKENPLFGVGMLNVRYYTTPFIRNNYLHNTFLEVFVEQGIVGGILYLGFFLSFVFQKCFNKYSKLLKAVIISQFMMIFFLTAVNNEALFLSIGLFKALNTKEISGIS